MNAIQKRTAVLLVLLLSASFAAGCYWLRYREIAATHLEILTRLAADARDAYVSDAVQLGPSDISRLSYPLDRARSFERVVRVRRPASAVLDALSSLSDAYAELVAYLDSVRGVAATDASRARVRALAEGVAAAGEVLGARLEAGES